MHTRRDLTSVRNTECSNWYRGGPYNTIRDLFGIGIFINIFENLFSCSSVASGSTNFDEYPSTKGRLYRFGSPVYLNYQRIVNELAMMLLFLKVNVT